VPDLPESKDSDQKEEGEQATVDNKSAVLIHDVIPVDLPTGDAGRAKCTSILRRLDGSIEED
jgi:hypothetical protein